MTKSHEKNTEVKEVGKTVRIEKPELAEFVDNFKQLDQYLSSNNYSPLETDDDLRFIKDHKTVIIYRIVTTEYDEFLKQATEKVSYIAKLVVENKMYPDLEDASTIFYPGNINQFILLHHALCGYVSAKFKFSKGLNEAEKITGTLKIDLDMELTKYFYEVL